MKTKISIETNGCRISWEMPEEDPTIDQFIVGVSNCLLGLTFSEDQIKNSMENYIHDKIF